MNEMITNQSLTCFHCDLPVVGQAYYVQIKGVPHAMCCIGCQMVATAIVENGLENYYDFRDHPSRSQKDLIPQALNELMQYDVPAIQSKYVSNQSIILSIDGITCAACIWLLEKRINRIPGVDKFTLNLSSHRAELRWDDRVISLSAVLLAISRIGYRAEPYEIDKAEKQRQQAFSSALKRLAVSGFGFGQVMMFAAPLYDWFSDGIPVHYRDFFRVVSLVVTTPVLIYCGLPFFKSAWISLKSRYLSMDVSITLALLVVYAAGVYATIMRNGEVYFDSITMFLFFITLSRYLEMRARYYSSFIVQKLSHHKPDWVERSVGMASELIPVGQIQVDDKIIVKSSTTIPVDGIVVDGSSDVSETFLTGEALPKMKTMGDVVVAGSVNISQPLTIKATKVGDHTTLAMILKLFERAQFDKPHVVTLTQKYSHYFILLQIIIAAALFLYWAPFSIEHAFWVTISLLVITCPCALAIATPIGLTASMNALSRHGFLCTRGHVLEGLVAPTDIVFDKTGTLTEGKFSIASLNLFSGCHESEALNIAASLEALSDHPIASAFKNISRSLPCRNVIVTPNKGIEGDISGVRYTLGNEKFINERYPHLLNDIQSETCFTSVWLATSDRLLAHFHLEDRLRENARSFINYLHESGYRLHLISGDNHAVVEACAKRLNIPNYLSQCSPGEKLDYVKSLQQRGGRVVMFGDGINDAPVLMQAEVSIAMSGAADLTRVHADAVLLNNDLSILETVFQHAGKTHRIIRQCLIWAAIYNVVCLPLSVSGLIAPYVAAGLMSLSSIMVVGNVMRLLVVKPVFFKARSEPVLAQVNT